MGKGMPWMYTLVSRLSEPTHPLWECPLCFAVVVGNNIKKHTAYHESRGESDGS